MDHELLIVKFRFELKKVGKTSRPFKYDLNQSPYDYTVELTNRVKGSDTVDRLPEELWVEVCTVVKEEVTKSIPQKKQCKKPKRLSEEALQIAEKRKEAKGREKRKHISI